MGNDSLVYGGGFNHNDISKLTFAAIAKSDSTQNVQYMVCGY